jgi:hypothetical protein
VRACFMSHRRWRGGRRRQRSHNVNAVPTGPRRRVSFRRGTRPFCLV